MTYAEFDDKLYPFFTPTQISMLNAAALESAIDAHGEPATETEREAIHNDGRDVICLMIADTVESPAEMRELLGVSMTPEKQAALIEQIDIEW